LQDELIFRLGAIGKVHATFVTYTDAITMCSMCP
jgi:hypothetical protein